MRRLLCLGGILIWVVATTSAQQADRPALPDFRSANETVRIDLRAVDAAGQFVGDLRPDEVRIFEDGREQTLTTFTRVDIPERAAPTLRAANIATNRDVDTGRVYVLLLDDINVHPLRRVTVRELAHRFVDRALGPNDRIALTTTSGIRNVNHEFTNDRAELHKIIDTYQVYGLPPQAGGPDLAILRSLREVCEWLGVATERRKGIVFISEGVPYDFGATFANGVVNDGSFEAKAMLDAAARANVNIYAVSPIGQPSAPYTTVRPVLLGEDHAQEVWRQSRDSMRDFASHTGGASLVMSNDFDGMFDRIVDANSRYYVAGYALPTPSDKRKFHTIKVEITRPGVTATARSGYMTGAPVVPGRARPPKTLPVALGETLQNPLPIPDVPLTISTNVTAGTKPSQSVVEILVEAPQHDSPLDVVVVAVKPDGRSSGVKRLTMDGANATVQMPLPTGNYHLRVAAVEQQNGRRGSVLHDFAVPARK